MYEKEKEELKAEQTKVRKELEEVTKKMNSQNSSLDNKDKMINLLEEELICSICSELFICVSLYLSYFIFNSTEKINIIQTANVSSMHTYLLCIMHSPMDQEEKRVSSM